MRRTVEGLHGPGRGRRVGTRFLSSAKETLIREIIEREYLKPTRLPVRRGLEDIGLACRRHGWSAPTWRTVKARLSLIGQRVWAVGREDTKAVRSLDAIPGEYAATRPRMSDHLGRGRGQRSISHLERLSSSATQQDWDMGHLR
jgi:putative transposase